MADTNKGIEEEVARAFVNHYYHLFDNDRSTLSTLYNPTSLLTFEGQKIYDVEDISNKLKQIPFDQCRHLISTVDSQPSSMAGGCGGILVFVSGSLQLHGEDHPLRFSQAFHLIPLLQGSFFVQNEMFRLDQLWLNFLQLVCNRSLSYRNPTKVYYRLNK